MLGTAKEGALGAHICMPAGAIGMSSLGSIDDLAKSKSDSVLPPGLASPWRCSWPPMPR